MREMVIGAGLATSVVVIPTGVIGLGAAIVGFIKKRPKLTGETLGSILAAFFWAWIFTNMVISREEQELENSQPT